MAESITYKCPSCGGVLIFDTESGKLKCTQCDTQITIEEAQVKQEESKQEQQQDFMQYKCSSCGAEILTDENTTATICSFCGSPTLIKDRLVGQASPKYVIPFEVSRKQMEQKFREWAKKGHFTPKEFLRQSTIDKITGLYAPYWLFDYHVDAYLEAHCTRIHTEVKKDIEYTYTDHFNVVRELGINYDKLPLDASKRLDNEMMDKLEPFDYSDLKDFSMQYLSGFQSEKYDETSQDLKERGQRRIRNYATTTAEKTIGAYSTVNIVKNQIDMKEKSIDYALLPVWILNYKYQGKNYTFALNGQTGKIVGNRPIAKGNVVKWYGLVFSITTIIAMLIGGLIL